MIINIFLPQRSLYIIHPDMATGVRIWGIGHFFSELTVYDIVYVYVYRVQCLCTSYESHTKNPEPSN